MPALTRRRDPDAQQETWQIYYGDVRVGTISEETGKSTGTPSWQWVCGFYPGNPAEHARGSAKTFDQAVVLSRSHGAIFSPNALRPILTNTGATARSTPGRKPCR